MSVWPRSPRITSWLATIPGRRTEWIGGGDPPVASAISAAVRLAVPLGASSLRVVVQLDDLRLRHVGGGERREAHHQHRADREVRRHEDVRAPRLGEPLELLHVEAGGADHGVHAALHAEREIAQHRIGLREVNDDVHAVLGARERILELRPERRIDARHELHVGRAADGLLGRLPHAPGGAGDHYPDHALKVPARARARPAQRRRRRRRRRAPRAARARCGRAPRRRRCRPPTDDPRRRARARARCSPRR